MIGELKIVITNYVSPCMQHLYECIKQTMQFTIYLEKYTHFIKHYSFVNQYKMLSKITYFMCYWFI